MGDRRSEIGRLAVAILARAQARGVMIATAESCTGGMVFAALTDIAGSSAVMERGFVTYSNDAKAEMLGVDPGMIAANGAVSEQVAGAMAEGALARSRAGLAVAVTGVAGPGGSAAKPEGMVCFALAAKGAATSVETRQFGTLGRATVRALSVERACELLLAHLSQN